MSSPTIPQIPNIPFPLHLSVATAFHDWQKHLQNKPDHYVNVVGFKLFTLSVRESVFAYAYLFTAGPGDVLTGNARIEDEDHTWNPENGWQGGDSFTSNPKKVAASATLSKVDGHDVITLNFGGTPQHPEYSVTLTTLAGKDPNSEFATVLTGDRNGITGGKAMATFTKDDVEKTHWPLSW